MFRRSKFRPREFRWSQLYDRSIKSNLPIYSEYSSNCILPINPNSGCDAKSEDHGADSQTTKRFEIRLFSRKLTIILSQFDFWILICFHIHMYTYIEFLNSTEARLNLTHTTDIFCKRGWHCRAGGNSGHCTPTPPLCWNGFYADISNQHQVQQYKSCLKSFL